MKTIVTQRGSMQTRYKAYSRGPKHSNRRGDNSSRHRLSVSAQQKQYHTHAGRGVMKSTISLREMQNATEERMSEVKYTNRNFWTESHMNFDLHHTLFNNISSGTTIENNNNNNNKKAETVANDMREFLVASTTETRVTIVKLADRLHNMRTLQHMSATKQKKIAMETLEIFVPLSQHLGMYRIQRELEDLSLSYIDPNAYKCISRQQTYLLIQQESYLLSVKHMVEIAIQKQPLLRLCSENITVEVEKRSVYSLYKHAKKNDIPFDNINDVTVLQIILTDSKHNSSMRTKQMCYHILGVIHALWSPLPTNTYLKDYIAAPKPNGYRAIHTAVIPRLDNINTTTNEVFPLHVQIQTSTMHKQQQQFSLSVDNLSSLNNGIREWNAVYKKSSMSAQTFMNIMKCDVLRAQICIFIYQSGDVISIPKGSTVIDYCVFRRFDNFGKRMMQVTVNGKMHPPKHKLRNGDIVDVAFYGVELSLCAQVQQYTEWLSCVTTYQALTKLQASLKR